MGVLYLLGRDGKVFCPPQFWDGVLHDSTGLPHVACTSEYLPQVSTASFSFVL